MGNELDSCVLTAWIQMTILLQLFENVIGAKDKVNRSMNSIHFDRSSFCPSDF